MLPLLLAVAASPAGSAAQPPAGFATDTILDLTAAEANALVGTAFAADAIFLALRQRLVEVDASGGRQPLHAFEPSTWVGTLAIDGDGLLFTSQPGGKLLRFDRRQRRTTTIGEVPANTFQLAREPASGVWIASANPDWPTFGARARLYAIDLRGGGWREIARLSGPSGPLAFTGAGDLLYATQDDRFPPPPGSSDLLGFTAAQVAAALAGRRLLTRADATVVVGGLDGAFALAVDQDDRVYVSDAHSGQVRRSLPGPGPLEPTPFLATGGRGTTDLRSVPGRDGAVFAPWQPGHGGELLVVTRDWAAGAAALLRITPKRPDLTLNPPSPVPAGPFEVRIRDAAPAAMCAVWLAARPLIPELRLAVAGGVPVWLGLDPATTLSLGAVATDGRGAADLALRNPGGRELQLTLQAFAYGGSGHGTTAPTPAHLLR